ncbi:PTS sugar transporter subunit IIA [Lactiplantibacillus pentosus]|uniref:PTS sugar transporter subunit IIA n=1 Tax=Lactiplantibacillus pentosus TaxID=1589 RepID=UPI0021A7A399|nr:PTS glucose transporter subunit IIA [Lactiplantibacillus pentosus]MCT3295456.1 PTS glucose transporter subunit IIA [Lactiplantibacillus pentosus]
MFGIKRKKTDVFEVVAPIDGVCVPITAVNDDVFAKKMMGDGFAIIPGPDTNQAVAPISGKIIALPESKHAIGIANEDYGISVLVHIGLDTVSMAGQGFTTFVALNQHVDAGTPLLTYDAQLFASKGLDMTTMVVFTDGYTGEVPLSSKADSHVNAGDPILKQA